VEYQIRLLDRLTSPLRETLSALQRVQAMRFVVEIEGLALEIKTAPEVGRLDNAVERPLRQLAEAILSVERNIVGLLEK
jgi:HAMP domain-containing protein